MAEAARRETVLVIDDSQTILMYVSALLSGDYHVKTASLPEQGLALAHASPPPDLILLDIVMPTMDGTEVCQRLKADPATQDIPVIFLTAMNNKDDEQHGFELGAVDYIAKPISGPILKARVRNHLKLKLAADVMNDMNTYLAGEVALRTRALEDALAKNREQTEQLQAIFDLSPDGFVSFDAGHRVRYASPAFLRMTGLAMAEIEGLGESDFAVRLAALCLPETPFPGFAVLRHGHAVGGGETSKRHLIELNLPGQPVLEVGLSVSAAANVSQLLYCRDVTAETEVDRMKSEFLSHAAHELRTPMASIFGYSELLLAQEFDAAEGRELLGVIHRQSTLLISIINELLDLARIEERRGKDFKLERIALQQLVDEVLRGYKPPDGRAAPEVALPVVTHWLKGDPGKLTQAIGNVIGNAYKYSSGGGAVRIDLVPDTAQHGMVGLRVRDQGIGLTPEQRARVCERFYRADASGKIPGSGLGMSIVKEIIELHGGRLAIESTFGKGTDVTLFLPLAH